MNPERTPRKFTFASIVKYVLFAWAFTGLAGFIIGKLFGSPMGPAENGFLIHAVLAGVPALIIHIVQRHRRRSEYKTES